MNAISERRVLFIINPTAGAGGAKEYLTKIDSRLRDTGLNYRISKTQNNGHAIKIAEESSGLFDTIVAVGGDGTVRETACGLAYTDTALGIISAGTGNDTVKSLGIPTDFESQMQLILDGQTETVDMASVGEDMFINVSSWGFDAHVVKWTNRVKKYVPKQAAYYIGIALCLLTYRQKRIVINSDNFLFDEKALLLAVGNGSYYGGGLQILPMSKMRDGMLSIILGKKMSRPKIVKLFAKLLEAKHAENTENVVTFEDTKLTVTFPEWDLLNIDGELVEREGDLVFKILPGAIKVIKGN